MSEHDVIKEDTIKVSNLNGEDPNTNADDNCDAIIKELVDEAKRKSNVNQDVASETPKHDDDKSKKSAKSHKKTKHRYSCPCGVCPLEATGENEICIESEESSEEVVEDKKHKQKTHKKKKGKKGPKGSDEQEYDDDLKDEHDQEDEDDQEDEEEREDEEEQEEQEGEEGKQGREKQHREKGHKGKKGQKGHEGQVKHKGEEEQEGRRKSDEDGLQDLSLQEGLSEIKSVSSRFGSRSRTSSSATLSSVASSEVSSFASLSDSGEYHTYGEAEGEGDIESYNYKRRVTIENQKFVPPTPAFSIYSEHEGSFVEDYMKIMFEPYICYKTLSSISSSYISCEETGLQRTIVIIKPQAVKFKETVYRIIFEEGIQILGVRVLHLSPEQVSEIYSKHYGSPSFAHLVVSISEAPCIVMSIAGINVIQKWLKIIGPDGSLRAEWFYPLSMRKLFGLNQTYPDWIHGSENLQASNKENRFFYPDSIIEPITNVEEKVWDYCNLNINKFLAEACTEVVKKRPIDPIVFLADYLLLHNPFQPRFPENITLSPT